MPHQLDIAPYPWSLEWARQLHKNLYTLHPSSQAALLIAKSAGVDVGMILTEQPIIFLWQAILDRAAIDECLHKMIQLVADRLQPNHSMHPFFLTLLNDRQPQEDAEPRNNEGAPAFNDHITDPEALLYHDDLTMQSGKLPALIKTLTKLLELSPAICKLTVDVYGATQYGTAFRISDDHLLTNWHVLHRRTDGTVATAVTAEFSFEDNGTGGLINPIPITCDANSIVASQADDWAIIRVSQAMRPEWPTIKLSSAAAPKKDTPAFIIQHPHGERKRIGFVRNTICHVSDERVHYLTDTQEGSSGSPVFDDAGKLIALHHAGGRPQDVVGKAPVKKNEGIGIPAIILGMTAAGVNIG